MNFPPDLPNILEYRCGDTIRTTLPRRPVESVSTSGKTTAAIVCPQIPYGCTGWRKVGEEAWRMLDTIPASWKPFLQRERPSAMDFRPMKGQDVVDAIEDDL